MKKAEKISRHTRPGNGKRFNKRMVKRARRRAEKRDPENAPRKLRAYVFGFTD